MPGDGRRASPGFDGGRLAGLADRTDDSSVGLVDSVTRQVSSTARCSPTASRRLCGHRLSGTTERTGRRTRSVDGQSSALDVRTRSVDGQSRAPDDLRRGAGRQSPVHAVRRESVGRHRMDQGKCGHRLLTQVSCTPSDKGRLSSDLPRQPSDCHRLTTPESFPPCLQDGQKPTERIGRLLARLAALEHLV